VPFTAPTGAAQAASRLLSRRLERLHRGVGDQNLRRQRRYAVEQRRLLALTQSASGPPYVLDVAPAAGSAEVHQLARSQRDILLGARAGYEAAHLALTGRRVAAPFQLAS
jgi:hypothetical protein